MSDIMMAKQELEKGAFSLVIVKDGIIRHTDSSSRLLPLVKGIGRLGKDIQGCAVADKVIGRAAACLLVQAKVGSVYSPLMSEPARDLLQEGKIDVSYEKIVPQILDQTKEKPCPMEQLVACAKTASEGHGIIMAFFAEKGLL